MAGDWIKMRASLVNEPKISTIGEVISSAPCFGRWLTEDQCSDVTVLRHALRHLVTGALHAVWCAANEHATEGVVRGASLTWIDDVSGVPHMGAAMAKVGWATESSDGLVFPKFDANNTSAAERQRRYRERKGVTVTRNVAQRVASPVAPREEKRREELEEEEDIQPPVMDVFGKLDKLLADWNACPWARPCGSDFEIPNRRDLNECLANPTWMQNYPRALAMERPRAFGPDGTMSIETFLHPETVPRILSGSFDFTRGRPGTQPQRKPRITRESLQ